jgi:LysR family nitrogen assimilation transcriptional regulator
MLECCIDVSNRLVVLSAISSWDTSELIASETRRKTGNHPMDLKQLKYFVTVADFGSFSRASESLSVAQSALSRHVADLEIELKQKLFYRTGRGVTLNEAGKRLYAHGRGILEQASRAKQDLMHHSDVPMGKVVLGLPFSVGRIFSARLVQSFVKSFPQVTLSVVEASSRHILEWLAAGRIDIGLVFNATEAPGIKAKLLVEDELCLMTAREGTLPKRSGVIRLRDLPKLSIIIPGSPHTLRTFVDAHLRRAGLALDVKIEVDSVSTIVDLVRSNVGSAILPATTLLAYSAERDLIAHRIVPRLPFRLEMVAYESRPQTTAARLSAELIETLSAPFKTEFPKRGGK